VSSGVHHDLSGQDSAGRESGLWVPAQQHAGYEDEEEEEEEETEANGAIRGRDEEGMTA